MTTLLPVPIDKPIIPVLIYHSQSPPCRPYDDDIPQDIIFAKDFICTQIANLVGIYAYRTKARMFCYNMVAYQNFDNIHFKNIYRYVCGLLLFKQRKNHLLDLRMSTVDAVHQVLAMYTAYLCNNYPEVMNTLTKEQIEETKRLTIQFEDVKAMTENIFQQCFKQNEQEYAERLRDIVFKCKDLYNLTPSDLEEDCHRVHRKAQETPLTPADLIRNRNVNPFNVKPVNPPPDFETTEVAMNSPHPLNTERVPRDFNLLGFPVEYNYKRPTGHSLQPPSGGFARPVQQSDYPPQPARQPLPNYPNELLNPRQNTMNQYPQNGPYPNGYPQQPQAPQQPMRAQGYYQPDVQVSQVLAQYQNGDRDVVDVNGYRHYQRFVQPPVQQSYPQHPQQGYPPQGYYHPDIPVVQVLGIYPNGDRDVIANDGRQYRQQYIAITQGQQIASQALGMPNTASMFTNNAQRPADNAPSNALKASMDRYSRLEQYQHQQAQQPVQRPPQPQQPVQRPPQPQQSVQRPPQQSVGTPMEQQLSRAGYEKVMRPSTVFNPNQEEMEDKYTQYLISGLCDEEEQMELRGEYKPPHSFTPFDELYPDDITRPIRQAQRIDPTKLNIVVRTRKTHPESFIPLTPLTYAGETEMERAQHQIVRLGGAIRYQLKPKFDEFEAAVNNIAIAPAVRLEDTVEEQIVKNEETGEESKVDVIIPAMDDIDYTIYPNTLAEKSIDDAIFGSRLLKMEHFKANPSEKLFRSFGIVSELLVSSVNIEPIIESIRNTHNFAELTTELRKASGIPFNTLKDKETASLTIVEIDRMIIQHVNDFMRYKLNITATINDTMDLIDLRQFLVNHYGNEQIGEAFDRFEIEFFSCLNLPLSEEDFQEMRIKACIPNDLFVSYLPLTVSFTHINLNNIDLELSVDMENKVTFIHPENHPALYRLIATLDNNKYAKAFSTMQDYLITADGVCYRIYANYLNDSLYLITK